jgi:hypothetical protein
MLIEPTKYRDDPKMKEFLSEFFTTGEGPTKMWGQLLEYIHPEGRKALEKYDESEKNADLGQHQLGPPL